MEILEMCRACLATGKDILPMNAILINKYNVLTNLNVSSTNDMPLYICSTCLEVVNYYARFREKCISSDLIIKNIVYEDTKGIIEGEIIEIQPIVWENCEEDATEHFSSPSMIKTEETDDWTPNETTRNPRKRKMVVEKETQKQNKVNILSNKQKLTNGTTIKAKLVKPRKKRIPKSKTDESLKSDYAVEHCGLCSDKFSDKQTLQQHLENHKTKNNCDRCSESCFIDFTHQLAHRFVHIPDDRKRCHLCMKKCKSHDHYECHLVKVHKLRGENGKIICKLCLLSYNSVKHLKSHTVSVHSEIKYYCDDCGKGFRMASALRSHLLSHTKVKHITCEFCDYTCKSYGNMKEHKIRKHTESKVYCKNCKRAFANQQLLDKHKINCKLMPCPVCGLFFYQVTRHLRTHTDKCRYKCDRCPKQFRSRTSYKYHINKHDGKKTFHCEHCPMKFYSQTVLIKHRRTHTGEKPYVCKICRRAFTGNHNLKVHMKVHGLNLVVKRTAPVDTNSYMQQ